MGGGGIRIISERWRHGEGICFSRKVGENFKSKKAIGEGRGRREE